MNIEVKQVEQEDRKHFKGKKRQRLPFEVKWDCPGCGERRTKDYSDKNYLSYPKWNTENNETLYCHDCGTEARVKIVPQVSLNIKIRQNDTE